MSAVLVLAVVLAVASSVAYAAGAVLQERLAITSGPSRGWRWVVAVTANLAGAGLHVLALRYGSLSVIQSLGALTLVFALPVSAALAPRRVSAAEWSGALMVLVGLAGIVGLTRTPAATRVLSDRQILLVLAVTAAAIGALILSVRLSERTVGASLRYAIASGMAFGVASAMVQTAAVRLSVDGLAAVTEPGVVAAALAVAGLAPAGFLLVQASYRSGLGAQLATGTLVNAITATVIGIVFLAQYYAAGWIGASLAVAAAILAAVGIYRLTDPRGTRPGRAADPGPGPVRRPPPAPARAPRR